MKNTQEFTGDLGTYKVITTEDGSQTLHSSFFDENCHSIHGAQGETQEYFINRCKIKEKFVRKGKISILEIGFGAGLGAYQTYSELKSTCIGGKMQFISCEIDEKLILWVRAHYQDNPLLGKLKKSEYFSIPCYEAYEGDFHLVVLLGDAVETIAELSEKAPLKVDAIYQDAFSPGKNPDLWDKNWFEILSEFADNQTILSTYSASHSVHTALEKSGWSFEKHKGFGEKRSSTLAHWQN